MSNKETINKIAQNVKEIDDLNFQQTLKRRTNMEILRCIVRQRRTVKMLQNFF